MLLLEKPEIVTTKATAGMAAPAVVMTTDVAVVALFLFYSVLVAVNCRSNAQQLFRCTAAGGHNAYMELTIA